MKNSSKSCQKEFSPKEMKIRFECTSCNKVFTLKENLKRHVRALHSKAIHKCETCGKTFSLKEYLRKHILSV